MTVNKADHARRIVIPGVLEPVSRPVEIDQTQTGFRALRTLRIYTFAQGSTIDGNAEEDEVFVVLLKGAIEMTLQDEASSTSVHETLSRPGSAAYLPPQSSYQIVATTEADVAYARATPDSGPPPAFFAPQESGVTNRATVLLEENTYAKRLHIRVMQVDAGSEDTEVSPLNKSDSAREGLLHVRTHPISNAAALKVEFGKSVALESWDSVAVRPGSSPIVSVAKSASALIFVVSAA